MNSEYPVSTLVPDGYRANPLPDSVRQWVDAQSKQLSEVYAIWAQADGDGPIDYDSERESQLQSKGWNWWGYGSERTVACLGSTLEGDRIYTPRTCVVIKFQPTYRPLDEFAISRPERCKQAVTGNLHELAVWKWACDHNDTDVFVDILDYSEYGDWVAQRYAIPVYPNNHRRSHCQYGNHDYLKSQSIPREFKLAMDERGYNPHIKDGNVGVLPGSTTTVCIDFGDHFDIDGVTSDRLFEYAVDR